MTELCHKPAHELAALIRKGELSPLELMRATLERIEALNPRLNAFVDLCPERALDEARQATEALAGGKRLGPLAGLPLAVKDLEDAAGMVTSYGSTLFQDNRVERDSVQVQRLRAAGAIVVGKTNTPEFGFTGFTKNRLHGVTRNPWDLERTPGGSSGGSAAAVTAGLVPLATGSDAGGSIRIPASYSGCFGLKPTLGRIPLGPQPCLSFTHLTVLGPLTRSVADAALYLDCTAGPHAADPFSLPGPPPAYLETLDQLPERLKIAFSPDLGYARVEKAVAARVQAAASVFEALGHRVDEWPGGLPDTGDQWTTLICMDLHAQLADIPAEKRSEIGRTLAAVVDHTRTLTVADLTPLHTVRAELNRRLETLFDRYDLLLTPTMPTEAFAAGGPPPTAIDGHPIGLMGAVAFTYPFNLSGHPAATLPVGRTPAGLPAGLQIVAPRHREDLILRLAHQYERARPWGDQWPM